MSSKYEYQCLNTHNCGYDFISNKIESRCVYCYSSFIEITKVVEMEYNPNTEQSEKLSFTPERLLGVETTLGFIVDVFGKDYTNPLTCFFFETTDGTSYSTYNDGVKFYISDDSDETVSFEEYIKLFYNTEDTL